MTKVKVLYDLRSTRTGKSMPREGVLVSTSENLGRKLLLVEFDNNESMYLFENEVEICGNK